MKKSKKFLILFFIFVFVLTSINFIRLKIYEYQIQNSVKQYCFKGRVSEMKMGSRDIPKFSINNKWISLGTTGHRLWDNIQIGDSVVKEKDSLHVMIYTKIENNRFSSYKLNLID